MCGSSQTYNIPSQPTYGEGMADALKAQMEMLTGTGEFAKIYREAGQAGGDLGDILQAVEAPIRMQTAQTDTDVLRQTMLGTERQYQVTQDPETGKFGIEGAIAIKDEQGQPISAGANRYKMVQLSSDIPPEYSAASGARLTSSAGGVLDSPGTTALYGIIDTETGEITERIGGEKYAYRQVASNGNILNDAKIKAIDMGGLQGFIGDPQFGSVDSQDKILSDANSKLQIMQGRIDKGNAGRRYQAVQLPPTSPGGAASYGILDTNTGGLTGHDSPQLNFQKQAILSSVQQIQDKLASRLQTMQGQIDEADGDNEVVAKGFTFINPNVPSDPSKAGQPGYDEQGNMLLQEGQTVTIREGDGMVDLLGDRRAAIDPATGLPSNRMSGFDEQGNFLGASALAEDIQRGNLSRQREADLADVERLSDRYQEVMADYKPESKSGLDTSRALLDQYFTRMTGMRKATQDDVNRGLATEVGEILEPMTDRQRIEQSVSEGQAIGRRLGLREQASPEMMGPNPLGQPQPGEQQQVVQQPTSFDPITTPSELQASDYAFTGDAAIGQLESGENTLRSALLGQARSALDAGLSDREMAQVQDAARARQTMMGRTFDQKGAIEEAEARVMEDNQRRMQNRAFAQSQLGQEAGLQTGDVTRAMTTDQFNVGAKMDAERLNEQLRQSGLGNYINAVRGLASLEDQYMLDPFQALLGRGGGGSLSSGQSVFGQAGYGLQSGPQYLNPESGLGFISQMAANNANMYAANVAADASRSSGLMGGLGALGGGLLSNTGLFGGK
jgi:hypothetical protein